MRSYVVCAQDGTVFFDSALMETHLASNPTHIATLGWGGDTCIISTTKYAPALIGGDITTSGTSAFVLLTASVQANSVKAGDTFRIEVRGVTAALGNPTFSVAVGASNPGTTVAWTTPAITSGAAAGSGLDVLLTVKSVGTSGTINAAGFATVGATVSSPAAATTTVVNTTAIWFITVRVAMSASTFRAVSGSILTL